MATVLDEEVDDCAHKARLVVDGPGVVACPCAQVHDEVVDVALSQ